MMTDKQLIARLLEFLDEPSGKAERQNHPEQLTDEQMQQILADDEMRQLVQQLGFAKRAFKYQDLANDTPDLDDEWEKFAATHAELLETLEEEKPKPHFSFSTVHFSLQKVAASFIGVLLASSIAFAAIHFALQKQKSEAPQTTDTTAVANVQHSTLNSQLEVPDTISTEPYVFNNVPLDSMLTAIAAAHGIQVEFENEAARELRFHFVWKREDSLTRVVEKLNTFEAVNIGMEDKTLVVR